jgi:choline kinase
MKAIILAAGAGRRLGVADPKCMVDVRGVSIIHRQLGAFRAAGVDDFVIVVGHERDRLRQHLAGQAGRFTWVVNERYARTNTIYSLYLAREHITDTFYYANADVVFDRRLINRLRGAPCPSVLAVDRGICGEEEVKVIVRDGRVARLGKELAPDECLGEFVGVARFGAELAPPFVDALTALVERENVVTDYFERAVDRLCADWELCPVDIGDLPCIEIDFPEDLDRARSEIAPRLIE